MLLTPVTLLSKRASSMKHCLHASRGAMVTAAAMLLVCTISTAILDLLSFVLAAPIHTAFSTWEPSPSSLHQLRPDARSFIFTTSFLSLRRRRRRSAFLRYTHTPISLLATVPSPLSPDLSFSRLYSTWSSRRSTVILSLSRSRSPLTCLSLFPLVVHLSRSHALSVTLSLSRG